MMDASRQSSLKNMMGYIPSYILASFSDPAAPNPKFISFCCVTVVGWDESHQSNPVHK